ncbi:MAG TPA: LemA family protein [Candidatus Paceibacterota bacterium]
MKSKSWLIGIGILVVLVLWSIGSYNRFVNLKENATTQWAQVETVYQRRFDLIPNLVNSVKGIMNQEKEVFTALADARTKYGGAATVEEKQAATEQVNSALSRLLVVVENYPQLRSSESVQTLMAQLEGTENRISVERNRYNDIVKEYNVAVKRFPGVIMAKIFGYDAMNLFAATEGAETAPVVNFEN